MLDLIGVRAQALADVPATDDDWYANLLWVQRRKCLLLMHTGTLFPVLAADISKRDLRDLGSWATGSIEAALAEEHFPPNTLGMLDPAALQVARTASRSMLGFMTQAAHEFQYMVEQSGGLERADVGALNHQLRRFLRNRGGYHQPVELAARRVSEGSVEY